MEVIVYSTPNCPFCVKVKEYLQNRKIDFTDYDVSKDKDKAAEMIQKSRQKAVPVLDINGWIIVGFRPEAIEKALASPRFDRDAYMSNVIFDPFDQ